MQNPCMTKKLADKNTIEYLIKYIYFTQFHSMWLILYAIGKYVNICKQMIFKDANDNDMSVCQAPIQNSKKKLKKKK